MARVQAEFDVFESEVDTLVPVGDELVFVSMNVRRRTQDGREYHGKLGSMFRVEDGLVTRGSDLGEAGLQRYWASLGLEPC